MLSPRTVTSGRILILPMVFDALVFVYPAKEPDELGIVVASVRGTCKFGSFGRKVLEGGGLSEPVDMRRFAQVPCHPARWIQKSTFLLPEVVEWLSLLATKSYPPATPNRINAAHKAEDESFFYDFVLPYVKGRPCDVISHRKMSENSPYGHVRFGLHALVVHALGLPYVVYKRLMVFFQLCTLRHFTGYFQNPNGLASLPEPVLGCLYEFLQQADAKRVVAASRLWGYQVLPSSLSHGKLHLERFAQSHPTHCFNMEGLYDRLLEAMQGVGRKLCKIASRRDLEHPGNHGFAKMVTSDLELLRSKMSKEGVLALLQESRDGSSDLHSALQHLQQHRSMEGTIRLSASISDFLHEVDTALMAPTSSERPGASLCPQSAQCPCVMDNDVLQWLAAVKSWMEAAGDENHFRVVLQFEEKILDIAMSGDDLLDWPLACISTSGEATALCFRLSGALEAYVAVCDKPNQPWTALRHSRIVLVSWTMACLQDAVLRKHRGDAFGHVLKDFAPPLAAHALEHLLIPEKRWMTLGRRVESYLEGMSDLKHQLLLPGKEGLGDFSALAAAATSHLPEVSKAWTEAQEKAQHAQMEWQDRSDQKDEWARSLAGAIEQDDKQLLQASGQQPWKRRKTSQAQRTKLAQEQSASKSRRKVEERSLQRSLPAKVDPLPTMSEFEAEAKAIIFSIHLPEELSLLGSSFCLARHLLDFDAGHPCEVAPHPAFSWHSHFLEFTTMRLPNLQAAPRFELFGDCSPTYRDGKQQENYNCPVKQNIGFYHPDKELKGLHVLWRWQGVLLNPFETSWPERDSPPELYRMEFPEDSEVSEEWILGLPSENDILAQMHLRSPFKHMGKAQFRCLGFVASVPNLHLRRLLVALQQGELPTEDPRVKAVFQQVLYRMGDADAASCFLGRCRKEDLLELADWPSVLALSEQFQALQTERGSIEALTSLMICCSYLAQFADESGCHPADQAMQICRQVLKSWAQEARERFRTQNQQAPEAEEVRKRLAKILLGYIQSFRLVPADGLRPEEAVELGKARIDLENCFGIGGVLLDETDMATVNEICFLHEHQLTHSSALDELLAEFLHGQLTTCPSTWQPPADSPLEMWRLADTTDGVVAIHPSRGFLLFNGKPVGCLPREIRNHPQFKAIFGDVSFFAWPLAKQGELYEAGPVNSKAFVFGLLPSGELLVQEKSVQSQPEMVLTLLSKTHMAQVGLRTALVENYTHWFCKCESKIWFRPKTDSDGREYSIEVSGRQGRLIYASKHAKGSRMQVFLPSEPGLAHLGKALAFIEPPEFVEYLGEPSQGQLAEVHLLRLGLTFLLCDSGRTLKSADFPGHQLASKQKLDMLRGFRCFLLLEEARPMLLESETWAKPPGLVVLPEGTISFTGKEDFLRCSLQFKGSRRKFSLFKVHWEDGQLEAATTVGRLQVASLLWACAGAEPEPLFGRPARWKALELLRQCWQNEPFDKAGGSSCSSL